jgi:hypothetical protein
LPQLFGLLGVEQQRVHADGERLTELLASVELCRCLRADFTAHRCAIIHNPTPGDPTDAVPGTGGSTGVLARSIRIWVIRTATDG